ncbi:MAG: hypothetical protein EOO57_03820 [Hymenobacter sp.]|nr:MAG: hypothetical protein EOO57_03820 [Hymenobacter sp.]
MIPESELILNPDGTIYHLNLLPDHISDTILTVGDPARVSQVSRHFDSLEFEGQHREFVTHVGYYRGKRLTVLSTGMGTDNIDIVMNELDALVNIDFMSRTVRPVEERLQSFRHQSPEGDFRLSNFEMETAGYYALGQLLGHEVLSLNAIVANRTTGEFAKDSAEIVDRLIVRTLALI